MSREELIVLVRRQAGQISAQDRQISAMAGQVSELMEANEAQAAKLARVEHLLSRNSGNSSSPPSRDGDPGKTPPVEKKRGRVGPARPRGKQRGAPGSHLGWTENPDEHQDRFPHGRCDCGDDLAAARDLGVVDRYQQHEIPRVAVRVTQYDQHQVRCGCGMVHTATRPEGARVGPVGYGPDLQAFAVYLMVVHFVPAHRVVALLESLTGAAPSVGFVHGMLARTAGLLTEVHNRIRTLITLSYAVACDETPLKVGPKKPKVGKKKAERYLLVACTELYTHYLLGGPSWTWWDRSTPMPAALTRSAPHPQSPPERWATCSSGMTTRSSELLGAPLCLPRARPEPCAARGRGLFLPGRSPLDGGIEEFPLLRPTMRSNAVTRPTSPGFTLLSSSIALACSAITPACSAVTTSRAAHDTRPRAGGGHRLGHRSMIAAAGLEINATRPTGQHLTSQRQDPAKPRSQDLIVTVAGRHDLSRDGRRLYSIG